MESPRAPIRLQCAVKNYEWGKLGEESSVARLAASNSGTAIEPGRPYAEFWMGTHESGPSYVASDVALKDWIAENSVALLGEKVAATWQGDLPFLFKVLSVAKALSIQAHPDKELAKLLHNLRPDMYKDSNYKPEMAIALTEFRALCGFITAEELEDVLKTVPEIVELIGEEKSNLQLLYTKLMSTTQDSVSQTIAKLISRLNTESKFRTLTEKEQLVLLLEKQYPDDIGVISAFFLNYVKLSPGEALYIGANEPHAYILGECIECMATSDNVVRASLTPKFRDVQTLCSMLTYKQGFPEILRGTPINSYISRYTPPFDEFEVDRCVIPLEGSVTFGNIPGPCIFLTITGNGRVQLTDSSNEKEIIMKEGDVFFLPANCEIKIKNSGDGELQMFRAGVNSNFLINL